MSLDPQAFNQLSYGVYLVTSRSGERLNGQLANAVAQVAASPARVAVALNKRNLTHEFIAASGVFGLSVLSEEAPMTFMGPFGFRSGREGDKLAGVRHRIGANGCPLVLDHAIAVFEAKVVGSLDVGSHTLFVGEITACEVVSTGQPMTYRFYHEVKKGKTAANAPTYVATSEAKPAVQQREKTMQKYRCEVCGYEYDPAVGDPDNGVPPGTPFEKLPADWVCPVCSAGKDQFSPAT